MPWVTLTTDFGTADGYVGAMKGVILSRCAAAQIVDISHEIPRHDVGHAAYVVAQVAAAFPARTIHVVVVDPGVGSSRRAVIVEAGDQLFVGPDNGVLALVAGASARAHLIVDPRFTAAEVSATFHGRDLFAPAAAALACGLALSEAGPAVALAATDATGAGARVVHVDAFGNLITNLRADDIGAGFAVGGQRFTALQRTYADVEVGQLVAYVGSAGTVEVAVREGSASERRGVGRGAVIEVEPSP